MIPLSERLLADAGGWRALKDARALHQMGRVAGATYEPPLLQGQVREGEREYRAGLRILSKSNIENVCGCRQSRQDGAICAHSIAVGLEILRPRPNPAALVPSDRLDPRTAAIPPQQIAGASSSRQIILSPDIEGPHAELFIVLAPNFPAGWEKDAITFGVEIVADGRRTLLSALDRAHSYRCDLRDQRALEKLQQITGEELPGMIVVGRDAFVDLLAGLVGHLRVTFGRTTAVTVRGEGILPELRIERNGDGTLTLHASVPPGTHRLIGPTNAWAFRENTFVPLAPGLAPAYLEILRRDVIIPADRVALFVTRELPILKQFLQVDPKEISARTEAIAVEAAPRFALTIEGSLNFLAAELQSVWKDKRVPTGSGESGHPAEAAAIERLRAAGFTIAAGGKLELRGEQPIVRFFARELPRLQGEWDVTIGPRFDHVTRNVQRVQPRLEIRSSGENWFDLGIELATPDGERFAASEIQRLLQSGRNSVRLRSGQMAVFDAELLDDLQQVLTDCEPQQRQPGLYRIDRRHAPYVETVATENALSVDGAARWKNWTISAGGKDALRAIPLGELESVLRDYQKKGVYWLNFLATNGLGGVLADEMGLGKTVQALAFISKLIGPSLVVCPSSLVQNWEREAHRFVPDLKCLALQGPDRGPLFSKIGQADVVITSYPLLRRDIDRYQDVAFAAMILDEAQHIKNPESQNAQSAQKIRAAHRFALTGTPIENSLRDIWSMMHFLMPGYLGARSDFKERFEDPIQRNPGGPEQRRLIQRLRPFILRRLKKSVATELPEKIEQVAYCDLNQSQQRVYADLLDATRRQLFETAGAKDRNKARMLMLTAILRLRQTCCDLRLLDLPGAQSGERSGKLELLEELLAEAVDGGHRVIVFSQFVSMLQLLREHLSESGIEYLYLDGATRRRQEVVDAFQSGSAPVFLMSLKAGGVGLNITAADTVVHFDPWWNPAVEAQATDRAHRIGQEKVVTSYKLIARNTIEEKILALQTKKRDLVDAVIESERPMMEGLTTKDLEELLLE